MTVLLTRKAVLQAALETTFNVAQSVGVNDGFLISNPTFTIQPNVLERNFVRNDLSPMPIIIGRKLAKMEFETELRGNGLANAGLVADAPLIVRLFQACGYAVAGYPDPVTIGPYDSGTNPVEVTWSVGSGTPAAQVLTFSGEPSDGDTVTIGGKVYTFKTVLANTDGYVAIGGSEAQAITNLKQAVNLGTGAGAQYATATTAQPNGLVATSTGTTLTVTAPRPGASYNSIAVSKTSTACSWGAGTLAGGASIASNTDVVEYLLTCTTPGASGTAQITVTSDTAGEGDAAATVTSGTPFSLGTKGLTITPTWTGALTEGMTWTVWLMPSGVMLSPISDNFQSATLVMHKDGVEHTMPGAFGTFEITAMAGNFATVKWTFTGSWVEPIDDPNPTPIFERTLPSQVQFARLNIGGFQATVEKLTFNQGNDVQIRPDVSSQDGYNGTRIVSRKPEGGINPEADLVANYDFWGTFAAATEVPLQMRIGTVSGNEVWCIFPNTQYSGLTYGDRSGILVYDAGLRFARSNGNDEAFFYFC
jgi:hypothetical protein